MVMATIQAISEESRNDKKIKRSRPCLEGVRSGFSD